MTRVAAMVVLGAVTAFGVTACAAPKGIPDQPSDGLPPSEPGVVMVSGRDDHGLVAFPKVGLRSAPAGGSVVGQVPDGTLARVREVRGTQVQVSASGVTGWVDDFALRGELRLAGSSPDCRVNFAGRDLPAGTGVEVLSFDHGRANVRLLSSPRTIGTVAASEIVELAPQPGQSCPAAASGRTTHLH